MTKYLLVSFYTLSGVRKLIDLGDFSYGEWVIYDKDKPKYIIDLHTDNESDMMINRLLNTNKETIKSLINKINQFNNTNLSLKQPPLLRFIKTRNFVELDLKKLPKYWLKNIY